MFDEEYTDDDDDNNDEGHTKKQPICMLIIYNTSPLSSRSEVKRSSSRS
jgi:hypothetical protein